MISTRADFNVRVQEIDTYFTFLGIIEQSNSNIQYNDIGGNNHVAPIDVNLSKILKANGFLLLYNLIESTVNKAIQAIFNNITDNGLTYLQLSENLKKLWINHKGVSIKGIENINLTMIRDIMRDIADSILTNEIASLDSSCIRISGNMDAQEIRSIARQIGFDESPNGRHLVTIKNKRNHLAHGDFSFSEIGRDYSVNDLGIFKDNTYDYLRDFMGVIEGFINDRKYSNSPSAIVV